MTENKKPVSVIFAPGCFDTFEGTQEELDALIVEIQETFANMTPEELEAQSVPLEEDSLSDRDWEILDAADQERGKFLQ